ncbi:hypothetical protein BDV98DRAFT_439251 [Pterulicium gracile]|uniref:Uncharacterized protein n=1 Tax=Pterulicium gracile TaxID=1884261 RepID=A0A5C3QWJ5_9AGAR|nr:hypothetical protein BDV98DRAFT_439251 [Pterula gracilis]
MATLAGRAFSGITVLSPFNPIAGLSLAGQCRVGVVEMKDGDYVKSSRTLGPVHMVTAYTLPESSQGFDTEVRRYGKVGGAGLVKLSRLAKVAKCSNVLRQEVTASAGSCRVTDVIRASEVLCWFRDASC